jgi:hypothetical protein
VAEPGGLEKFDRVDRRASDREGKLMKYLILSLAAIALAGPVQANNQTAPGKSDPPSAETTETSQNRVICKKERITGSRLGSREICKTEAQWNQIRHDERQALERGQANRPTSGG